MQIPHSTITKILRSLTEAQNITIISHRNPDADTIGSNLALREFLESAGKNVTSACVDPPPKELAFLTDGRTQSARPNEIATDHTKSARNNPSFTTELNLPTTDLIIAVDCGSTSQTVFLDRQPEILQSQIPIINIDHHPSNNGYGTINLVIDDAASATFVIFNLFKQINAPITPGMATNLLCGLYYDTGSFMHSNVNAEVYQCASELLRAGANMPAIVKNMYKTRSIEQLKTWGKILDGMKVTNNNVVVGGITQTDLNNCSAGTAETSGIIDYLSTVKNAEFATLLVEDDKGNVRGSFRTRKNDVNLSEMAGMFGGGGHKKASGFTLEGELAREVIWKIKHEPT